MLLINKIYVLQERDGHKIYVLSLIVPCRYVSQYLVSK